MNDYLKYYAAWICDKNVLAESTSGGVFTALAEVVLSSGGIVVGASYDDSLNVRHEIIQTCADLKRLRGVKYVRGIIGHEVYGEMREALAAGRKVMFVGLPCQAAAVRRMFGRDLNLLICDLVCFGTPPHSFWRKYIDWLEHKYGKRLVNINPRDKIHGWGRRTYYRYEWEDGKIERRLSLYDPYAQAFYSTLAFGTTCFSCKFRGVIRESDITLCDMWNFEELNLSQEVLRGGVSGVIVHSELGGRMLAAASVVCVRVAESIFLKKNPAIVRSPAKPFKWSDFASDSHSLDFDDLIVKYHLKITPIIHAWRYAVSFIKGLILKVLPQSLKDKIKHCLHQGDRAGLK